MPSKTGKMNEKRSIDKLADYIIKLAGLAAIIAVCWYFKKVLVYIIVAFVISLIGRPVMHLLRRFHIKKFRLPNWFSAVLTILLILGFLILIITQMIPMVTHIIRDASLLDTQTLLESNPMDSFNAWLIEMFPNLGSDFDLKEVVMGKLRELVSVNSVTGLVGTLVSLVSDVFVGVFAVVFISFFFLKDADLFERIICALVPDRIEQTTKTTLNDIKKLLSRYFVGLVIEMFGVALIDFLGLWLIARLDFSYAIGIAFVAGILNVIPYVGPLIGEVLGVVLGVVLKIGIGAGLDVNVWIFALIIFAIMFGAQLVDNLVYQPVIYSTSIKAYPLEIFIVLLMAGFMGGMVGMLVAIPAYTVLRVVALRFFYRFKPIQRLNPDLSDEDKIIEDIS